MSSIEVLASYTRLREAQGALNDRLTRTLSKRAIEDSAKNLGLFEAGRIVTEDPSHLGLVFDSAIYDYRPSGGKNAVARFASQHAVDGDEKRVLDAMLRARFTLVELGEPTAGVGVAARDVVFGGELFLADVALSEAGARGVALATRLLAFDGFSMTTGVHTVVDPRLAELLTPGDDWLAGRAGEMTSRESSLLARLYWRLSTLDYDRARAELAGFAVSMFPRDDPRRAAFLRLRAARSGGR